MGFSSLVNELCAHSIPHSARRVIIRAEKLPNKELFMMRRWIALVCLIMLGTTAQAQVVCKASPNKITVEINGQPFTTFHYGNN
jgi:hypothetical protein